jgi:spastin
MMTFAIHNAKANSLSFLGATNRPHELDEALLRRFPQRIMVDLPDRRARAAMIRRAFDESQPPTPTRLTGQDLECA